MPLNFKEDGDEGVQKQQDPVLHEPGGLKKSNWKIVAVVLVILALAGAASYIYFPDILERQSTQQQQPRTEPVMQEAAKQPDSLPSISPQTTPPAESTRVDSTAKTLDSAAIGLLPPIQDTVQQATAPVQTGKYTIFVARFRSKDKADTVAAKWERAGQRTEVTESEGWFRASIGRFATREEAKAAAEELGERLKAGYFIGRVNE
ncbi:MAG TPA: SPOR domain-containing protein [Bacteroidota bacterium]|jgi:cell division protein FtsN|nr:SPOR domain-containing protein [Bacteroidota bacterium]